MHMVKLVVFERKFLPQTVDMGPGLSLSEKIQGRGLFTYRFPCTHWMRDATDGSSAESGICTFTRSYPTWVEATAALSAAVAVRVGRGGTYEGAVRPVFCGVNNPVADLSGRE